MSKQNEEIKTMVYVCLRSGMTDKQEIYDAVVEKLNVPRPTVRRVACIVRKELMKYSEILNSNDYSNKKRK